jgi:hypothetical protein
MILEQVRNFGIMSIEESLSESEGVFKTDKKQIFYFDDFLGSNYFEAIENKKDSHIMAFIDRVAHDNKKVFILTSRTNILNHGVLYSPMFNKKNIQKNEYMITIENLTSIDKAKILYNHIWFSNLPSEFFDKLYESRRYINVVNHKNYNPRIIEFITDVDRVDLSDCNDYWLYVRQKLDNPKDVWNDCFKFQSNPYVRNLVSLIVFNGGKILEYDLEKAFYCLNKLEGLSNSSHAEKDFDSTSRTAIKSFANRRIINKDVVYSLFNPSISDYILAEYCCNFDRLLNIFSSLNTLESLRELSSLSVFKVISKEISINLKRSIFKESLKKKNDYNYMITSAYFLNGDEVEKDDILLMLNLIINDNKSIKNIYYLMSMINENIDVLDINSYDFILNSMRDFDLDDDGIKSCAEFMFSYGHKNDDLLLEIKKHIESFLVERLESRKDDVDISSMITYFNDDCYGYSIDESAVKRKLTDIPSAIEFSASIFLITN